MKLKITLCLAAASCLMAVLATPALAGQAVWTACQEYPEQGQWENNLCSKGSEGGNWETEEVAETEENTSSASALELTDTKATGGSATIKCAGTDVGWIDENFGGISQINTTKCTRISGECEAEKEVKATPIDLPWYTELREETGGEVRDRFQAGGKGPGYKIECEVGKILKIADECFGTFTTKMQNNRASGAVETEFDSKSGKTECTLGGKEAGEIKGVDTIKRRPPGGLMVGPRPPVDRTGGDPEFGNLNGGVIVNVGRIERFRFENNVAITYTSTMVRNFVESPYTIVAGTTCTGSLVAGKSCVLEVEFRPLSVGNFSAVLGINYTAGGVNGRYRQRMFGTGLL
jgi:hypothetical protein